MDMLQDNPTIDTSALPTAAPTSGSLDFTFDGERFTLSVLHPRVWTLFRVTRYATTPLFTIHELAASSWRAYRHDGRVTRLDAATFPALLERALA
ncbi:hypothetical protein ITJ64_03010 [Herbiconiux sp. VKM Ac-1786]|uniref:hypothetical protein n=1 Tax=Herbiconiux sp. VKM Ac-1786 TaxID=2783824 RepID=UPI001889EA73|nr:hypothetical protein [Herbiconiux sp. VKM Ac-1786]MBF4571479.1 hypothetical protein [Herbiconiux sp. VKM Ac-1786]